MYSLENGPVRSPLFTAIVCERLNLVSVLLEANASPQSSRGDPVSPLRAAVWMGHGHVVEKLLRSGATIFGNSKTDRKRRPLLSVALPYPDCVRALLAVEVVSDQDVIARDLRCLSAVSVVGSPSPLQDTAAWAIHGVPPLLEAAVLGHLESVKLLLDARAPADKMEWVLGNGKLMWVLGKALQIHVQLTEKSASLFDKDLAPSEARLMALNLIRDVDKVRLNSDDSVVCAEAKVDYATALANACLSREASVAEFLLEAGSAAHLVPNLLSHAYLPRLPPLVSLRLPLLLSRTRLRGGSRLRGGTSIAATV